MDISGSDQNYSIKTNGHVDDRAEKENLKLNGHSSDLEVNDHKLVNGKSYTTNF